MALITLDGTVYVTEAIEDTSIPAHDYDGVIDISKSETPDQWFGRVQSEWPSLPNEIKHKVIDTTSQYIGRMATDAGSQLEVSLDEAILDEAAKDANGNEIYDFAEGRKHAASLDNAALEYVRQDLIDVIKIQERSHKEGHQTPKLGYYWDEYWTVVDEIARRMKKGEKFNLTPWALDGQKIDDKIKELGN